MQKLAYLLLFIILGSSCKKDGTTTSTPIPRPVITAIDKMQAQAGDTILITGSNLLRDTLKPRVFINGREAALLDATAEKLSVRVPEYTRTGNILLFLGNLNVEGPELRVIATPRIISYEPRFVVKGDTLTITGESFSTTLADNQLFIGGKSAVITSVTATQMKVLVPTDATTGTLSCSVFNGPLSKFTGTPVLLREKNYNALTIGEYLQKDPGFSFINAYFDAYKDDLADQSAGKVLTAYLNGDKKGIMFIPNNYFAYNRGWNSESDFTRNMRWYEVFYPLLAVTHNQTLDYDALNVGFKYPAELGGDIIQYWIPGTRNYFTISQLDGLSQKYVTPLSYGSPIANYKILRQIDVNGSIIYEIDVLPTFDSQPSEFDN